MRVLASILLALCFVSVSALASYNKAETLGFSNGQQLLLDEAPLSSDTRAIPVDVHATKGKTSNAGEECPCKNKSDSLTLTCGVTLALSGDDTSNCLPGAKRGLFAFEHTDRDARMMYLLRRPPRTVL